MFDSSFKTGTMRDSLRLAREGRSGSERCVTTDRDCRCWGLRRGEAEKRGDSDRICQRCPVWLDFTSRNSYNRGMKSTVSEEGQVTIPKPLRKKLGLGPGQILEFETRDGML